MVCLGKLPHQKPANQFEVKLEVNFFNVQK